MHATEAAEGCVSRGCNLEVEVALTSLAVPKATVQLEWELGEPVSVQGAPEQVV